MLCASFHEKRLFFAEKSSFKVIHINEGKKYLWF